MSVTVQDRFLRVRDCIGDGRASAIIQETLDVPGEFPEVERVAAVRAVARVRECVCSDGRVTVHGAAEVVLLYAAAVQGGAPAGAGEDGYVEYPGEEGERHRLVVLRHAETVAFEVEVEVPGAASGMEVEATVVVESAVGNLVNRRRLTCDLSLAVECRVHDIIACRAAVDVTALPPDRVRVGRERVRFERLVAAGEMERTVETTLVLPPGEPDLAEALEFSASPHGVTGRATEGRAFVEGALEFELVYLTRDPGRPLHAVRFSEGLRFSHAVELADCQADQLVRASYQDRGCVLRTVSERELAVTVTARIGAVVVEGEDLPLVTEVADEANGRIDIRRQVVRWPQLLMEGAREAVVAGEVMLPPTKPPVESVVRAEAAFILSGVAVGAERVTVEGEISLNLLYLGAMPGHPVHMAEFPRSLKVAQTIEVPGLTPDAEVATEISVAAVNLRVIDPDTLRAEAVLRFHLRCLLVRSMEVVVECVVVSLCPPGTSLRMIVVQPGDTLWKLARRYGTTVEAIAALNKIANPDVIDVGQRLRIPCGPATPAGPAPGPGGPPLITGAG